MKNLVKGLRSRWTGLYALLMLTVFVLWVPGSGYTNMVAPKHALFLGLTALYLLGAPFQVPPRLERGKRLPLALAGALLLVFLAASLASPYQDVVWLGNRRNEGFVTLALYLLIFAGACLWGGVGKPQALGTALAACLMLLVVLLQFLGHNPLGLYPEGLGFHDRGLRYSGEYLGTIGNADLLSNYLAMAVLFLLGTYAVAEGRYRFFCLAGAGAAWMALLLSEVTGGPVAVAGCLALCLPLCLAKGLGLRRMGEMGAVLSLGVLLKAALGYRYEEGSLSFFFSRGPVFWLALGALLLCLLAAVLLRRLPEGRGDPKGALGVVGFYLLGLFAVFLFLLTYEGDNETLRGLSLLLHGSPPDSLGSSRIAIWREAVKLGLEEPWLGSGPDTYQLRSALIFTRELGGGAVRRTSVDVAHCEYLNLWVNTGLLSMLLFLALLGSVLLPAARRLDKGRLPLLLPALGYAIAALFGISQSLVSPLFYLFLGALACMNPGEAT